MSKKTLLVFLSAEEFNHQEFILFNHKEVKIAKLFLKFLLIMD